MHSPRLQIPVLVLLLLGTCVRQADAQFCGDGIVEHGEDCDDGGICIGGSRAGVVCTSDADCGGTAEEGVCAEGVKAHTACRSDSDCSGSTCVRCRTFGGDGCSANCTNESEITASLVPGQVHGLRISPGTSGEIIHGDILTIPLPLSGTETFIIGRERNGRIPVVQKPSGIQLPRIPVQTLACACVRATALKTCGGTQFDADGKESINCTPGETTGTRECAGNKPCTYVFGPGNSGGGIIGCDGLGGVNFDITQDGCVSGSCDGFNGMSGPVITQILPGVGAPGSWLLFSASTMGVATGLCTGADPTVYGLDGEFCTGDDPQPPDDPTSPRGQTAVEFLTTGTAIGFLPNANTFAGNDVGPFSYTGNPVSCSGLLGGNFSRLTLAGTFTALRRPTTGDIVASTRLVLRANASVTPSINVGTAIGAPGQQVPVDVTLTAGTARIAGTQNDLAFDGIPARIATDVHGRPDCAVNPAIRKGGTSFGFLPSGCTGTACTGIRALVLAIDNSAPIPDGSVLYTCNVNIAATAVLGEYPLIISGVVMQDPNGMQVANATGRDGKLIVTPFPPTATYTSTFTPTRTRTATPIPTQTPGATPVRQVPSINVGTATGPPGQQVSVDVTLTTGAVPVVAAQNDLAFDGIQTRIATGAGERPDCAVNPRIRKSATAFAFQPRGCSGRACTSIRAVVVSTDNSDPIPDGSVLYTCKVRIAAGAPPGEYPLTISGVVLSDSSGGEVANATGTSGKVVVTASPPTATYTPTSTQTRTRTATPIPTRTPAATPVGQGPSINVGDAVGAPGQQVVVAVALTARDARIAATQNDLAFDGIETHIAAKPNGRPDCVVNPAIHKGGTSFGFLPPGCSGTACTGIRALVVALDNSASIPDGSVLYTCKVNIAATALPGEYPLTISGVVLSDPSGFSENASGTNGKVIVTAPPATATYTPTVSPTHTPIRTPTPSLALHIGSATGLPNNGVRVAVSLSTRGQQVAAAQLDVGFGPGVPISSGVGGRPNCDVNPTIAKDDTSFTFQPPGCTASAACTGVRAIVISFSNTEPIPDGAVLFSCAIDIARTADPGPHPLVCAAAQATDPSANPLAASCTDGAVEVEMACPGDCNGDRRVTVDELLTGVSVGLGNVPLTVCPAFDADLNRRVTIDELLKGVVDALSGCPAV